MLGGFGTAEFGAYTISVTCPAPCAVPTGVSAGTVTSSGASVTWAGTGTFVLEYGPTGFTPGTGATAGAQMLQQVLAVLLLTLQLRCRQLPALLNLLPTMCMYARIVPVQETALVQILL